MRSFTLCIASLIMAASICVAADDKQTVDKRLDQFVTTQHTSGRLHTALEQLSKLTGVRLNCGRDKDDWQVRDIPVIICAKDVPLGKLLRSIADTTHLALTSQKTENDRSYRIWRTPAMVREWTEYEQKKREWKFASTAWEWDVVAKLKDLPESALPTEGMKRMYNDSCFREASPLLAALGTEARDSIINGEPLKLSLQDASVNLQQLIENYLRVMDTTVCRKAGSLSANWPTPSDSDFRKCSIIIDCPRVQEDDKPSITMRVEGPIHSEQVFISNVNMFAMVAKDHLPKQPEEPKMPRVLDPKYDSPTWLTKVSFKIPKEKEPASFGDACAALAEASGYAVVVEDFHSHQPRFNMKLALGLFEVGTELADVNIFDIHQWWSVDDKNKILMGTERFWTVYHRGLAPERIIEGLRQKLNTDGAEFDDVTPLANLTKWQLNEWIEQTKDLTSMRWPFMGPDKPLWAFYNNMSAQNKEQVKSEDGLRLNRDAVITLASAFRDREENMKGTGAIPTKEKWWEKTADPEMISDPVIRLRSTESQGPAGRTLHKYSLEFTGRLGTDSFTVSVPFLSPYPGFPIFSDKRQAELLKENVTKG